jgi:hypothetical protein
MVARADYREYHSGRWRLLALQGWWNLQLQEQVLEIVGDQVAARHPQTLEVRAPVGGAERCFYLKVFHRMTLSAAAKDVLRQSRAWRFWRQGLMLSAAGFNAPLTIALGRVRGRCIATREFVLTNKIDGASLPLFLHRELRSPTPAIAVKRVRIRQLARLIRQFHDAGFVHGDLVASNIFVAREDSDDVEFYFMDNDRTRHYPSWLPQRLWKRNLIQLSRLPLAGISLQDRLRFLHCYLNVGRLSVANRELARWLEVKTRRRRRECDGVDVTGSFRKLMRWVPEMTGVEHK